MCDISPRPLGKKFAIWVEEYPLRFLRLLTGDAYKNSLRWVTLSLLTFNADCEISFFQSFPA
jgi:hypothetical protein